MSEEWVGSRVSLDCGGLGFFQGIICRINLPEQTVTLQKPFQNGIPSTFPEITLNATDIQDLKILKGAVELAKEAAAVQGEPASTVSLQEKSGKDKRGTKAFKEAGGEKGVGGKGVPAHVLSAANRHSPRFSNNRSSPKRGLEEGRGRAQSLSEGGNRTPSLRQQQQRQRDEDCFGAGGGVLTIEERRLVETEEFDFEKNLAMFDKKGVMAEIDADLANKPDIVRLVHTNKRQPEPKYRNDENVLASVSAEYRQIKVGEEVEREFLTDAGLVVPSITQQLRDRLWQVLDNHGLDRGKQAEVFGRAATELAIQLLGGQHRLSPTNMHQVPLAVFLLGPSPASLYGLAAARHLAGHGVRVIVYQPHVPSHPHYTEIERKLLGLTGSKMVSEAKQLPTPSNTSVDLIVTALEDHEMFSQERCQPWHRAAIQWAEGLVCPVLALDPPACPPPLPTKMTLVPGGLPLAHHTTGGKLYMANMGIPRQVYKEVGIEYRSPFGAKFVIPLHSTNGN